MKRTSTVLSQVAAAVALGVATLAAQAANGEGQDFDAPSVSQSSSALSNAVVAALPRESTGPLTRAEVKEALQNARNAHILTPTGEIGDTDQVLARREQFNQLQAEVIQARYAAAMQAQQEQQVAAAAAAGSDDTSSPVMVADAGPAASDAGEQVPTLEPTVVVSPDTTVRELFARMGDGDEPVTVVMDDEVDVD